MVEGREQMDRNEFRGARLRIFGTKPDNPEDGRIFLWTKVGWFERIVGRSGGVAFIPIAKSEDELRKFIARSASSVDLVQLGREFRKMISEEFIEQSPSYRDSSEYSSEDDIDNDEQKYHQHD